MRFHNIEQVQKKMPDPFASRKGNGPLKPRSPLEQEKPQYLQNFGKEELIFSWFGHSSVFLHMNGMNILIDPVFSQCISPCTPIGPHRFPMETPSEKDFPEIDLILITHNHHDHLDKTAICALAGQTKHYVVPKGIRNILTRFGIDKQKVTELDWNEAYTIGEIQVICMTANHNSSRALIDWNRTLWCSYVVKSLEHAVYITGDTSFASHFQDIYKTYGAFDLVITECGQYGEPWHHLHMFPEEAVEACKILHAGLAIPVHWGAYILSTHPWDDPPKRFRQRAEEENLNYRIPIINRIEKIK